MDKKLENKTMKTPLFKLSFLALLFLLLSCNTSNKETKPRMKVVSDLKGKFEVKLPMCWHKEFNATDFSSGIITSDTTKELKNAVIININWNKDTVFINPHLERTIDSLNNAVGLTTQMNKRGVIGDYKTIFNFSMGYDSISKLKQNQYLYILKEDVKNGHIFMTATVYRDSITNKHSELVAEIVKTIKMNQ
jgi:hypothetical protein